MIYKIIDYEKRSDDFMFELINRGYLMLPKRRITRMTFKGENDRYLLYLPENHEKIWHAL
ncbi:MAG: hypothetical protein ACP5G1_04090 [Nanopusillaceae archaeon]